jgi:hypothetical protein
LPRFRQGSSTHIRCLNQLWVPPRQDALSIVSAMASHDSPSA